ncbi:MAG TPA: pyridoxamine 5'-phosphate oxidase family protein [Acidimicrobiia bacterium]
MKSINLGVADDLPPVEWSSIVEKLDSGTGPDPDAHNARSTWLTTLNADGSPHVTPVGAIWMDGTFWFQTGDTRKRQNIMRDPRCSIALSIRDADVVLEGEAMPVSDPQNVARAVEAWNAGGWPVEPDETGVGITAPFNAPAQGPPPWTVFRIDPRSAVVALGTEPGGLTRFEF